MSLSLGTDLGRIGGVMEQLNEPDSKSLVPKRLQVQETVRRYQNVDKILADVIFKRLSSKELLTENWIKFWFINSGVMWSFSYSADYFSKCFLPCRIPDELD